MNDKAQRAQQLVEAAKCPTIVFPSMNSILYPVFPQDGLAVNYGPFIIMVTRRHTIDYDKQRNERR